MAQAKVNPNYTAELKKLNAAQRQAVDTIEGPVMVVAGPGTGKTQILTVRIANILLRTQTPPDGILALTFTEAGVDAMKARLLRLIGPTAYKVGIYTFHGFCNDVIHAHPEYFPRIISSKALTDIESIIYIREALSTLPLEKLKPFGDPYFYVSAVRSAISTLKREHKTPQAVLEATERALKDLEGDPESYHEKGVHAGKMKGAASTKADRLRKEHELGLVYEWYEAKLASSRKFDFEDMIGEVVRALSSDEEFLLVVQEKYLYILADEHQDANGAQNKLLELLASYDASPNLFIVGDEKQAIFRFQGATLDSFDFFKSRFPSAVLIPLLDSYRSGSVLLDAAHSLMAGTIPLERHPKLVSKVGEPHLAVLQARAFTSEELEIAWVAEDIAAKIAEGVSPADIAVIFRTNADALPISRALAQKGILHTLDSKSTIFANHTMLQIVTYLRLCTHVGSEEYMAHVLHFPWVGIEAHDAYKLLIYAQRKRMPYIDVIASKTHLNGATVRDIDDVHAFAATLKRLAVLAQEESARDFFDSMLHESGLLRYILTRADAIPILNSVRGLASTLETLSSTSTLYTGRDFVHDIGLYEEYGIEIEPDVQPKERSNAVHLVTAHRSKGLEYEYVYIIHARDGKWGNRTARNNLPLSTLVNPSTDSTGSSKSDSGLADIDDERRLFYVALTRAKLSVSVSYGITSSARTKESMETQFLQEIDQSLIARMPTEDFESTVAPSHVFAAKPPSRETMDTHAFLIDAFVEQGLSATALNNYLECPWKYFYRNLVRVPEKPTSSSLYGNALHNALRLFRDLCSSTQYYQPLSTLLEYLQVSIEAQGFTPSSYADAQKKGVRALTDWYERNKDIYQFRALCEKKFEVYMPLSGGQTAGGEPERILLRGLIDVIEFRGDNSVRVIDYKTGKHKSRNELEGGTKNATGDYKRQLDFYCILMELGQMELPKRLTLEFIEPDTSGKTVEHTFDYDETAVTELRRTIERVSREIYTLSFWDAKCDEKECEYCVLRNLIFAAQQ